MIEETARAVSLQYYFNWFPGSAWEPMSRGSASAAKMEAEPPDLRYQALPGNEYNHLGLLYRI